jgi:formyltetrahydrofolate-dependent phosphoribosylglycinamide formyltransferase
MNRGETGDRPVRLAVLVSGNGRSLQNLIDRIRDGSLHATIEVVVSSNPSAYGLERARQASLPCRVVHRKAHRSDEEFGRALAQELEGRPIDLVIMAGFLHLFLFPEKWAGRVLNIHPALLPDFGGAGYYGHRVHKAVLQSGARESGCTVHYADLRYDHGPVILQRRCPVLPDDTPESLAERVFKEECEAYPEAIRRAAESLRAAGGGMKA